MGILSSIFGLEVKDAYVEGFDWAAGKLLRKEMTVREIEDTLDEQCDYWTSFDYGAKKAIAAYLCLKTQPQPKEQ